MIKLYYSSSPDLAKRAARRDIKKEYPVLDESSFVSFNMAVTPLRDLAEECSYLSLGVEKKAVLAYDCAFLGKSKTKPKYQKDDKPQALLDYLQNPIYETDLYLLVYNAELDEKSEMVQAIKKNGFVKEVLIPAPGDWVSYAEKYLASKGVSIEKRASQELVRRVNNDFGAFTNELDKLAAYANGEMVRYEAVASLVTKLEEDDAFAIGNALVRGNNGNSIEAYKKAKKTGADEIRLINMLAGQLLYLDQVRFLDGVGYDVNMIARELGGSPKRAEIALSNLYGIPTKALEEALEGLYETEKNILSGLVPADFAFSLYLTNTKLK